MGSELLTEAMRTEMHKLWGEDMLVTSNYGILPVLLEFPIYQNDSFFLQ